MKIQSAILPQVNVELKSDSSASEKISTKNVKQAEKLTKFAGKERVAKWFAQAGVYPSFAKRPSQTLDEKILAKNTLKERRKFANLERILGKALDFCLEETQGDDIDPDWFFSFLNMAEDVYSAQMQEVWGKIFAVESSQPGSFSLKTLQTLKQLTQKDALIFRQAVNLASKRKGESAPKILLGYYRKKSIWSFLRPGAEHQLNLAHFTLSYPDLLALMDLGLIHHSEIESGELALEQLTEWRVAGHSISFVPKHRGLTLVYFKFTTTGAELSKLVTSQKQDAYVNALKQTLAHAFEMS
ncbi:TIGR03899 family protein [Paraglaciecola hydrolytica]|uniref:TIGR03899 family protein n=1 Tax=Paraglaciecola hydrolytica TaxID=1799789 RepID=A0A136A2R6_9ALTE|nr:TIGR03899 family protein [Paraglaciecola hydrolytica]KXI29525.1 hypothetical protein AX660_05560 [Paraglaciecola hydrolytica]